MGLEITCSLRELLEYVQEGDKVKVSFQHPVLEQQWNLVEIDPQLASRPRGEWVHAAEQLMERNGGGMLKFVNEPGGTTVAWVMEWGRFRTMSATTKEGVVAPLDNVKVTVIPKDPKAWEELRLIAEPPKPVTMESFKDLTIPEDMKEEVVAVMKQFEKRKILMEDWGLGEIIEYGLGMIFLFHGPPGTGKTYTARLMAKAIGRGLVTASNAELESNIPGQYERNLKELFAKAKKTGSVLFFDECDGMIQSRQGMGQIMSSQNNCFLQEVEKFEGIVVMATNRVDSLDEALERRISLILEFKNPDQEQRTLIWERHLPKKMPLAKDVKVDHLSEFFLSGGQIKNVVLNAARFAVSRDADKVYKKDFVRAIERVQAGSAAFSTPRSVHRPGVPQRQSDIVRA